MKPTSTRSGSSVHFRMSRFTGLPLFVCSSVTLFAQEGGKEQRAQADALFAKGQYAQAYSAYEILLGNDQQDFDLNFRYGVCALHAGADKGAAIAYLKRSTQGPAPDARSWYWLGKAYHLTYRFKEALVAGKGCDDHTDVCKRIFEKMERTWQWRRQQLEQGQLEIRTQRTAAGLEEIYAGDLADLLEMKTEDARWDDYRTLIDFMG